MKNAPNTHSSFPIRRSEEHRASRREFTAFMGCACLTGLAFPRVHQFWQARVESDEPPPLRVAKITDLEPGQSLLFHYPSKHDPCILVRHRSGEFAAFSQSCTHLMCPVHYDARDEQLVCPCHQGFFSAVTGDVIAGPPPRPLPRLDVRLEGLEIWIHPMTPRQSSSPTTTI